MYDTQHFIARGTSLVSVTHCFTEQHGHAALCLPVKPRHQCLMSCCVSCCSGQMHELEQAIISAAPKSSSYSTCCAHHHSHELRQLLRALTAFADASSACASASTTTRPGACVEWCVLGGAKQDARLHRNLALGHALACVCIDPSLRQHLQATLHIKRLV